MKTLIFLFFAGIAFQGEAQQTPILAANQTPDHKTFATAESLPAPQYAGEMKLDPVASFPFDETAFISYAVPKNFREATILIKNSEGKVMKEYPIGEAGEGTVTLFGGTLVPGCYFYSLNVDGRVSDSRKLIVSQ